MVDVAGEPLGDGEFVGLALFDLEQFDRAGRSDAVDKFERVREADDRATFVPAGHERPGAVAVEGASISARERSELTSVPAAYLVMAGSVASAAVMLAENG